MNDCQNCRRFQAHLVKEIWPYRRKINWKWNEKSIKSFQWPLHYSDRGGDLAIFLREKAIFFYSFERQFLISHLQFFRECFVPIIKITTNVQRNGKNANIRNTNSSFKSSGKFNILVSWAIGASIFISILLCLRQIHGNTMLSLVLHSKNSQLKKKKNQFCAMPMVLYLYLLWVCCSLDLDMGPCISTLT